MTVADVRNGADGWTQQMLDALVVPVFALDPEYRYLAFNAAHAEVMKAVWGVEIALGARLFDYLPPGEARGAAIENMTQVLAGEHVTSSVWFGDDSKPRRLFSLIRSPIVDDGKIVGVAIVSVDETERKRAEDGMRQSEARFRATFEQSAVGMALVGIDGRWMHVNDRLCEMLGYTRDELASLTFADITSPDTIEADLDALRRFQAGEDDTYRTQKRYIRKDDSLVWVDLMSSVVRDEDGAPQYFVDMIEDIDDRKKAERALRDSEERYRALVEAVRDIVFVIDAEDRVEYVNDAAAAWLERSPEEIIGQPRGDVFPPGEDWSRHQSESLRRVFETGEPVYVEHPAHFPGGMRWQATSLAPLRDGDGRISGVLGIGRDITERKRAEQRHVGELEQLAHADALTGLLNRRGFDLLSKQALAQAARAGQGVGVIYGDMDGLKAINDELGHAAGDQALRDVATILRVTLRSADVIGRLGGDEFVVLAVGEDEDSIHLLADRLQEGIAVLNAARDGSRTLSMSCGVAWRDAGTAFKVSRLVAEADEAMYREKTRRALQRD
jgi:diguanylate cyclase (GGDEF)-like protein/PAS domain S-box-containing protein